MKKSRLHGGKQYKPTAKRIMPFDSGLRLTREQVEDAAISFRHFIMAARAEKEKNANTLNQY